MSMSDLHWSLVRRQLAAADAEEARLRELARMSGALPDEWLIVWRFRRDRGGMWPFLE
jgi:hypothetical protein